MTKEELLEEFEFLKRRYSSRIICVAYEVTKLKSDMTEAVAKLYEKDLIKSKEHARVLKTQKNYQRMCEVLAKLSVEDIVLPDLDPIKRQWNRGRKGKGYHLDQYKKDLAEREAAEAPLKNEGLVVSSSEFEGVVREEAQEMERVQAFEGMVSTGISEDYIVNMLKGLAAEARLDKKYKESKDCVELLARILGIVGEKVKKETTVTTRNVTEISNDLMLATKALGMELPQGVISLLDSRKSR